MSEFEIIIHLLAELIAGGLFPDALSDECNIAVATDQNFVYARILKRPLRSNGLSNGQVRRIFRALFAVVLSRLTMGEMMGVHPAASFYGGVPVLYAVDVENQSDCYMVTFAVMSPQNMRAHCARYWDIQAYLNQ